MTDPAADRYGVLVVSTHYPGPEFPTRGLWVERLVLASRSFSNPTVVVPMPRLPAPFFRDTRRRFRDWPAERVQDGVPILCPRTGWVPARTLNAAAPSLIYRSILELTDRLVAENRPKLIHAHFIHPEGVVAARLGRRYGLPVMTTEHANWIPWLDGLPIIRRQVEKALPFIDTINAVSEPSAAEIRKIAPNSHVAVTGNVLDDAVFRSPSPRMRESGRILVVGAVRRVKGVDVAIRAMPLVTAARPDARLDIVGDPYMPEYRREQNALRRLVDRLGLADHVRFLGPLTGEALVEALSNAAVLALPSRRESFGAVAIEALACGTPVVATRCGGPEGIVDPTLGRLVDVEDVSGFASALLDVMDNPDQFDPEHLRASVVERFGLAEMQRRQQAVCAEAIERGRRRLAADD